MYFRFQSFFPSWIVKQESRCSNLNLQSLFLTDKSNGRILRNWYGSVFHVPIIIPSRQAQQEDTIWFSQSQRPTKVSSFQTGGYWLYQQKDAITPSCQSPTQGYHYSFLASPSPTGGYFAWISPMDAGWRLHTWETKDWPSFSCFFMNVRFIERYLKPSSHDLFVC